MNRSRIGLAITALALSAGVGLTACSQPAPQPAPGPSAKPASSPIQDAPAAAAPIAAAPAQQSAHPNPARPHSTLADGRHPARITAVDPDGEQVTIDDLARAQQPVVIEARGVEQGKFIGPEFVEGCCSSIAQTREHGGHRLRSWVTLR